jgi:hypothetical protein
MHLKSQKYYQIIKLRFSKKPNCSCSKNQLFTFINTECFREGVNFLKNLPNVVPDATRFQPNIWRSTSSNLTTAVWLNLSNLSRYLPKNFL